MANLHQWLSARAEGPGRAEILRDVEHMLAGVRVHARAFGPASVATQAVDARPIEATALVGVRMIGGWTACARIVKRPPGALARGEPT